MVFIDHIEKRFGVTCIAGYDSTEIAVPLLNTLKERKKDSCGKQQPNYVVKLLDDNGMEVGSNVRSELFVHSLDPFCIFLGYYKLTKEALDFCRDLWLHTGDYLVMDEDGYFNIIDRRRMHSGEGEKISSYKMATVINSHPAFLESAAVAVKSELGEDEVMICVSSKPGETLTPEVLLDHCQERMACFMIPHYVRSMHQLPKTPTERIKKSRLREDGITQDTWDREKVGYKLKR